MKRPQFIFIMDQQVKLIRNEYGLNQDKMAAGGDVEDIIVAIAFCDVDVKYPRTMGGKIWWKTVLEKEGYVVQQNILSHHYRLLDPDNRRRIASFDYNEIEEHLDREILKKL